MTRTMGDATHDNVSQLEQSVDNGESQMVAGYVTGSSDILWTPADWALFPGIVQVTIDQGFTGSPVASANVRDVEAGAWTVANAVNRNGWTAPRPTIYCSLDTVQQVAQAGWQGDLWVADYVASPPAAPPPMPSGIRCVGTQWTDTADSSTIDLSVIFDESWPAMSFGPHTTATTPPPLYALPYIDAAGQMQLQTGYATCNLCWSSFWYAQRARSHCAGNPQP